MLKCAKFGVVRQKGTASCNVHTPQPCIVFATGWNLPQLETGNVTAVSKSEDVTKC